MWVASFSRLERLDFGRKQSTIPQPPGGPYGSETLQTIDLGVRQAASDSEFSNVRVKREESLIWARTTC